MRKLFYYSLLWAALFSASSCKDTESEPPKPSFTVDKTSGLTSTTFTFTVNQVDANSVSVLPYGTEHLSEGGILISTFTGGKATVTFTYAKVGTFNAVVVSNNHSADGKDVKNTYSDTQAITITSDLTAFTDFSFPTSTDVAQDETTGAIVATVPFGTDVTKLVASYTTSDFTTVTVGGAVQTSGKTAVNFTTPVTYHVVAANGTTSKDYSVTVNVTPVEKITTITSFSGTTDKGKVAVPGYVDNTGHKVVLYNSAVPANFDSVAVSYALDGKFAFATLGSATDHIKQGLLFDLSAGPKTITVHSQDSVATKQDYTVYSGSVPEIIVNFPGLFPVVQDTSSALVATADVLKGTNNKALSTVVTPYNLPSGVTTGTMQIDDDGDATTPPVPFVNGDLVDYSADAHLLLQIIDSNPGHTTYWASYTISVNVVK